MIKISAVLPSLNVAEYIEETIKSVINQSLSEIEILCIDAGSTDGTLEIMQNMAKQDSRIVLLSSEKRSYGYQVNKAIDYAQGEYIAIIETDDFINPLMFETLYNAAHNYCVDIVKGDYAVYWTQNNGERVYRPRKIFSDNTLYNRIVNPLEVVSTAYEDWYLWTGLYRREFLIDKAIRLSETPGAAFQDIGFLHRTNSLAQSAYYVEYVCYNYCIDRAESSSNTGNGLFFSFNEYNTLLDEEWGEEATKVLYLRMARSFVSSCNITKELIEDEAFRKKYEWYVEKIQYAINEKYLRKEEISVGIWNRLMELLVGVDLAYQKILEKENKLFDTIGSVGENRVIIFGCGDKGRATVAKLRNCGYQIHAFMDNNSKIWNTYVDDIVVLPPQKLLENEKIAKYIIANEVYYEAIYKQLIELEIEPIDICVYV